MKVPPQVAIKVHSRSTADQIFCICQILEKRLNTLEQYISYRQITRKAYDSVWREILYSVVTEFSIPMELDR